MGVLNRNNLSVRKAGQVETLVFTQDSPHFVLQECFEKSFNKKTNLYNTLLIHTF